MPGLNLMVLLMPAAEGCSFRAALGPKLFLPAFFFPFLGEEPFLGLSAPLDFCMAVVRFRAMVLVLAIWLGVGLANHTGGEGRNEQVRGRYRLTMLVSSHTFDPKFAHFRATFLLPNEFADF